MMRQSVGSSLGCRDHAVLCSISCMLCSRDLSKASDFDTGVRRTPGTHRRLVPHRHYMIVGLPNCWSEADFARSIDQDRLAHLCRASFDHTLQAVQKHRLQRKYVEMMHM